MIWENVFAILTFISGVIYLVLGLVTSNYQEKNNDSDKGWVFSPFWAFSKNAYNEKGKKLCAMGIIVLCVSGLFSLIC